MSTSPFRRIAIFESLERRYCFANVVFGQERVVLDFVRDPRYSIAADVDGDADLDVIMGHSSFAWHENVDGKGVFSHQRAIDVRDSSDFIRHLSVDDLDSDGDIDILTADIIIGSGPLNGIDNLEIAWYENELKSGFGRRQIVGSSRFTSHPVSVEAADLDGDGDLDVVAGSGNGTWFENVNGKGNFGLGKQFAKKASTISSEDLDGDRDLDLIVVDETDFRRSSTGWYENVDGKGTFRYSREITFGQFVGDMDRDGALDVLVRSPIKVAWIKNLGIPGDANNDKRFDSADLLIVFQAGEYEDSVFGNSTRAEGDFNGDGDFNSADLVFAFSEGSYVSVSTRDAFGSLAAVDGKCWSDARDKRGGIPPERCTGA